MKQASKPLIYQGAESEWEKRHALRGRIFHVIKDFKDADNNVHAAGETWTLVGTGFNRFEDMMWLGLRLSDGTKWLMPLDWRDGRQADVLEHWTNYVRPA